MEKNHSRIKSFHFAFSGLSHAFFNGKNFQIQLAVGLSVVALAIIFGFSRWEWIILVLVIGLVLTAELLNTVIEVVVDLAVKEKMLPEAKIAKDVAAASVLLLSGIAAVVGLLLFWPHFQILFQ